MAHMGLDLQVTTVQMIILLFFNTAEVSDEVLKQLKNGAGLRHCLPDTRSNGQLSGRSRSRPVLLERALVDGPFMGSYFLTRTVHVCSFTEPHDEESP